MTRGRRGRIEGEPVRCRIVLEELVCLCLRSAPFKSAPQSSTVMPPFLPRVDSTMNDVLDHYTAHFLAASEPRGVFNAGSQCISSSVEFGIFTHFIRDGSPLSKHIVADFKPFCQAHGITFQGHSRLVFFLPS